MTHRSIMFIALFLLFTFTGNHSLAAAAKGREIYIRADKRQMTPAEKSALFDRAGIPKNQRKNYVIDHILPLELGGTDALSNLHVQSKATAKQKHRVERFLVKQVKSGKMSLLQAQQEIGHWQMARMGR